MSRQLRIAAWMALLFSAHYAGQAVAQTPLSTAFTYQGQLKMNGVPLTGTAAFEFSLWDDAGTGDPPAGGNQIGPTLVYAGGAGHPPPIALTNGLFTVELDFGIAVFAEEARWLQIAVRTPARGVIIDPLPFTALSPRQPITPAPLALKTLGISPRQIAALEAQSAVAGLVNVSPIVTNCLQSDERIRCDENILINIALQDGVATSLELVTLVPPGAPREEAVQLVIEKRPLPVPSTIKAFTVNLTVTQGAPTYESSVSPADPIYASDHDPTYPLTFVYTARLIGDAHLTLETAPATVKWILTESRGSIAGHQISPYGAFAHDVNLTLSVANNGDYETVYIVSVSNCPPTVDPIPAQAQMLAAAEDSDFVFTLHNSVPFGDADACTVTLKAPHGKIYESTAIDFPPPTGN